ncbi:MAG: hypothetical protein WBM97_11375, partial [Sedimenticolaceae bacterium]
EVERAVFRGLWKFVFRLTDEKCETNRAINYSALNLLYGRGPAQFQAQIQADKDYFSAIATGGAPVTCLIYFLSRSTQIYGLLADHAKTAIQHATDNDKLFPRRDGVFVLPVGGRTPPGVARAIGIASVFHVALPALWCRGTPGLGQESGSHPVRRGLAGLESAGYRDRSGLRGDPDFIRSA